MYKINPPKIHLSTVLGYDVEGKRYIVKDEKIFDTERELVCFLANDQACRRSRIAVSNQLLKCTGSRKSRQRSTLRLRRRLSASTRLDTREHSSRYHCRKNFFSR